MSDLTPTPCAEITAAPTIFINQPTQFRLGSSNAVYAPGVVAWLQNMAATGDAEKAARLLADTWSVPLWAAEDLVNGRCTHAVEGETLIFPAT